MSLVADVALSKAGLTGSSDGTAPTGGASDPVQLALNTTGQAAGILQKVAPIALAAIGGGL